MVKAPSLHYDGISFEIFQSAQGWSGKVLAGDEFKFAVVRSGNCWLECAEYLSGPLFLTAGAIIGVAGRGEMLWRDAGSSGQEPVAMLEACPLSAAAPACGLSTRLLFGTARLRANPLLLAFPRFFYVSPSDADTSACIGSLVDVIEREAGHDASDQHDVVRRAAEILLIVLARQVAGQPHAGALFRNATADPKVLRAIRLIEAEAARSWTVESLAAEVGMGRSAFALRFRELVGDTPVSWLFKTRMRVASDLICSRKTSLAAVAEAIGYQSESAFSKAFVRHFGVTPGQYRAAANDSGQTRDRPYRHSAHPLRGRRDFVNAEAR